MTSSTKLINGVPLLKVFLVNMAGSALLLVLLMSGVLVNLSRILTREAELADVVLPNMEMAHEFTSATAGLQLQGQLMSSASLMDALIARNQVLEGSIQETRALLDSRPGQQAIDTQSLVNTIDQIQVMVVSLFDIRKQHLNEARYLQQQTSLSVAELSDILKAIQAHTSRLIDQLHTPENMLPGAGGSQPDLRLNPLAFTEKFRELDSVSTRIQEYFRLYQSLDNLKALVQQLPLLSDNAAIELSSLQHEALVLEILDRTAEIKDDQIQSLLEIPFSRITDRFDSHHNLFESAASLHEMTQLEQRLSSALTGLTNEVPAVAKQMRSQSEALLASVFRETGTALQQYRWIILGGLGLSLLILGTVGYWLVYRQTVLPLEEISGQLDTVGTDGFTSKRTNYFIQEMAELSAVVDDLDQAHKEMQRKDVQLQVSNKELRRANEDLEQFAHVASHDLQEPLRMLQQFSEMLVEDYQDELDDDGKFYIQAISSSAQRMSQMIRDTLEYASSSRTSQSMTAVDLTQIINDVCRDKKIIINESGARVTTGNLPCVMANATGMTQMFGNLLVNALKYRREDVACHISIEAHYPTDIPVVEITVTDNGVGIADKYLERIFSPFERFNNSVSGTGLGLAICTKVCESHNWTMKVTSTVGTGSSFRIRVPLAQVIRQAA